MNQVAICVRLLAGLALGIFFYGGLWFTVERLARARNPALLALGSFWIRMLAVLAGFLLLMNQRWQYGLALLAGFTAGRLAISKLLPQRRPESRCT